MQNAVIFDIDDTLYDQSVPVCNACEEALGITLEDREHFYRTFHRNSDRIFHQTESHQITLEDSRLFRILNTTKDLNLPMTNTQAESFQKLYQDKLNQLTLSEEITELMEDCARGGLFMGILTNGPFEHQLSKYYRMELDRWIPKECVVISEEAGAAKPSAEIFRIAEKRMSLIPERTWMVGDSFINDITGAAEAGWRTIWYNHHGEIMPDGVIPDHIVHTEQEMADCIRALI